MACQHTRVRTHVPTGLMCSPVCCCAHKSACASLLCCVCCLHARVGCEASKLLHVGVVGHCRAKHGDPHRGGMHSFMWQRGMLIEAEDHTFDKDDMVSATALASAQLNLLQPETLSRLKMQRMMGLYTALSFNTTSRTVYDWVTDGPAEGAQQYGPFAKVMQSEWCWGRMFAALC